MAGRIFIARTTYRTRVNGRIIRRDVTTVREEHPIYRQNPENYKPFQVTYEADPPKVAPVPVEPVAVAAEPEPEPEPAVLAFDGTLGGPEPVAEPESEVAVEAPTRIRYRRHSEEAEEA